MDGFIEQRLWHAQVAGEEAGEVERLQRGFSHRKALGDRPPCACEICSNPATAFTITRAGVMLACPICSEIAFSQAAQPLSLERFYEGEREHDHAFA
jgi:hypothetical protein